MMELCLHGNVFLLRDLERDFDEVEAEAETEAEVEVKLEAELPEIIFSCFDFEGRLSFNVSSVAVELESCMTFNVLVEKRSP